MHTFFRGWRRKWGCITLLMACLLVGMWNRGRFYKEIIELRPLKHSEIELRCTATTIDFEWRWETSQIGAFQGLQFAEWSTLPNETDSYQDDAVFPHVTTGRWNMSLGNGQIAQGRTRRLIVPYVTSIAILTLLSAWLILWKPAKPSGGVSK